MSLLTVNGNTVHVYDISPATITTPSPGSHVLPTTSSRIASISYSPCGSFIASGDDIIRDLSATKGGTTDAVKIWQPVENLVHTFEDQSSAVNGLCYSPRGGTLCTSMDELVKVYSEGGEPRNSLFEHTQTVNCVCHSPCGGILFSGSDDKSIIVWDASSGTVIRTLRGHSGGVNALSCSPCGRQLCSGSADSTLKVWDVANGNCIQTLRGHKKFVTSVCYSPCGMMLCSGSWDKSVKTWDPKGGTKRQTFSPHSDWRQTFEWHRDWVTCVCYSPCGTRICSGSVDETIIVWDTNGKVLHTLTGHVGAVNSISFSPCGGTLCSGGADKTVRVWNVDSGKLSHCGTLPPPDEPPQGTRRAMLSPCGGFVFVYTETVSDPAGANTVFVADVNSMRFVPIQGTTNADEGMDELIHEYKRTIASLPAGAEGLSVVSCAGCRQRAACLGSLQKLIAARQQELAVLEISAPKFDGIKLFLEGNLTKKKPSLGSGNTGTVNVAHDSKTRGPYAVKRLNPDRVDIENVHRNLSTLVKLKHDHVVCIEGAVPSSTGTLAALVMEYVGGGTLRKEEFPQLD